MDVVPASPMTTMELLTPILAELTAEGVSLTGDVTAEEIALTPDDTRLDGPLAVGLDVTKVEETVCVTGVVEGMAVRECVRCLKDFEEPVAFSLRVVFEPEPKAKPKPKPAVSAAPRRHDARSRPSEPETVEVDETDDDVYHYQGDRLDLGPMLREQVILAAPMHPLCNQDCAGLCDRCGKDLNEGPCGCQEGPGRHPFDVLRGLKTKEK